MLEEDLSMPNMALDLIGQARNLYSYAAQLEGRQRSEDDFAYLRSDREYLNCLLVERGNTDFAHTMLRQFYFAAFMKPFWHQLQQSTDTTLKAMSEKAEKEIAYHIRHAGEWVIRLGDGTEVSAQKMRAAVSVLHPYTEELFSVDANRKSCIDEKIVPAPEAIRPQWTAVVQQVFEQAKIEVPQVPYPIVGGREGRHTEEFGYLLAELQYIQRAYPGAQW